MITFRELMDGRILYHDISALYGPFYYLVITPALQFPGRSAVSRYCTFDFSSFLAWLCCDLRHDLCGA